MDGIEYIIKHLSEIEKLLSKSEAIAQAVMGKVKTSQPLSIKYP
jgi:hypothetical protein